MVARSTSPLLDALPLFLAQFLQLLRVGDHLHLLGLALVLDATLLLCVLFLSLDGLLLVALGAHRLI